MWIFKILLHLLMQANPSWKHGDIESSNFYLTNPLISGNIK